MSRVRQTLQQKAGHQLEQQAGESKSTAKKNNPRNSSGKNRKY